MKPMKMGEPAVHTQIVLLGTGNPPADRDGMIGPTVPFYEQRGVPAGEHRHV